MRFKHFAILIAVLSIIGCSSKALEREPDPKLIALNDSIAKVYQKILLSSRGGKLEFDTLQLRQMLALADTILKYDESGKLLFSTYYNKNYIYQLLGERDNALAMVERAMLMKPEDDVDRMGFFAMKYHIEENKDSAQYYYDRCIDIYDAKLKKNFNIGVAASKAELILLFQGKEAANAFLSDLKKQYSEDEKIAKDIDILENDLPSLGEEFVKFMK